MKLEKLFEKYVDKQSWYSLPIGKYIKVTGLRVDSGLDDDFIEYNAMAEDIKGFLRSAIKEVIEDVVGEEIKSISPEDFTEVAITLGRNSHHSECIKRAKEWGYEEK